MAIRLKREEAEQAAVFEWIAWQEKTKPEYKAIYHVSNGAGRISIITRVVLKLLGVRPGVPDICVPIPRGKHPGLYIEMKVKPNRVTKEQEAFMGLLHGLGHRVVVAWSAHQAIELIREYVEG